MQKMQKYHYFAFVTQTFSNHRIKFEVNKNRICSKPVAISNALDLWYV